MLAYANKKQQEVTDARAEQKNAYSLLSFNCMTYAVVVFDIGKCYHDRHPGKWVRTDHPNDDIESYMESGNDDGIFDDRMHQKAPEAVSGQKPASDIKGIRQRQRVSWINSIEGDLVVHHHQPNSQLK